MKQNEPNEKENINISPEAVYGLCEQMIEQELMRVDGIAALVVTLREFGIRGAKALSFVMSFLNNSAKQSQNKKDEGDSEDEN